MNKREKELQQAFLNNEKAVLKNLEEAYKDALGEINSKIELLMARQDADMQHVIYQVEYQKALKTQVQSILENLQANEFETVSDYLTKSYEDGYIGALYNIQGQGIPLVFPIEQAQVVQAIQTETKLSEALYTALGKDIKNLQKNIAGEISRGLATGMMYSEIARNVSNYARIPKNNAMRITRTEAHRIQCKAGMDACVKAKERGADVIKQWDSSLDKRTRDSHVKLDGERRELEEKFSNGLMYAGDPSGRAEEVINCRCAILQRAKWALDRGETKHLGDMSGMSDKELEPLAKKLHMDVDELRTYQDQIVPINAKDYADFKKQYNQLWNYQGSEVQKRAEERIAGHGKNQRVRSNAQKMNDNDVLGRVKTPLLSHEVAEIDYRAEKVTFKDLQSWKKSIGNVTDEEYSIISGMSDTGYIRSANSYKINKAMREDNIQNLSEGNQKTISTLKEVIGKNVSDRDAVLIRKVDFEYLKGVYNIDSQDLQDIVNELNKKVGATYVEKGFVSTSYKLDKNLNANDKIELDISAPKGTNMFLTKNRDESEIILQASTRFELEGAVLTDEGKVRVLMKVVPDDAVEEALENIVNSSTMKMDLQFFGKKHKTKKVPNDNPLWDSLVQGNVEQQMEDGIFEWEHGGYDYLIEIKEKYDYEILSKKKKPNIHE